jgi:hypothetical protein
MGAFNSGPDREQEQRRLLLSEARNGKKAAREELQREYNVRVFSAEERAKLYYEVMPQTKGRLSKRHLDIGMQWAQMDESGVTD